MLLVSGNVLANDIYNPKFFNYQGGTFVNHLMDVSFGWFKKLDDEEKAAHNQAITHALMYSENGQSVTWYQNKASGYSVPVMTWPSGSGYCRRLHIQVIAHGIEKTMSQTACFENAHSIWRWLPDK
jgi:surface antigen